MDARLFGSLAWRCIGPHRGGRVVAVAGHPQEPGTFYFGACAGGVWKTTNAGSHWRNVSDGFFGTAAVGALAVAESDPEVVYAGTGEACIRSNVSHGDGVYRSDDGGRTWRHLGLRDTRHISHIAVHPHNPEVVYVAALGHAWGPNPERGVYRSQDGGATWERVLYRSQRAGAADLSLDPHNPRLLYAAMWQAQRYPHAASSGGEESGIWRSLDGGDTWTELSQRDGLPKGILGRIGLAASPAQAGRVWAIVEAEDGAVFRSDDYGEHWQRLSQDMELRRRPWYYMHIFADPQNANAVWVLNLNCWRSIDGGKSFERVPTPHGDNHALWIDPRDSNRMIEGNDGGACITFDGARTWSSLLNQPTAQFYHVTTDDHVPYRVCGSQQDNWAMRLPSVGFEGAITWADYTEPGGGESGYIAISRRPPHTVFGGAIGTGAGHGRLIAWNPDTGQKRNVTVWPEVFGMGAGAEHLSYRFQWTFPVETSPHDDRALYICSNVVHRSTDEGASWEVISPDLTRNDPTRLGASGGPITADNSGAEIYCTIFAFRESPHEPGVFWAGSDDGLVHLSRDGGQSWHNITPPQLPEWSLISIIEPSPHDPATVYLAATRYKLDDLRPYLLRSNDYGASWTAITHGIPDDVFTRVIRADPNRPGLLYCGTETGIFISFDDGARWQPFEANLPLTPIYDLVVKGTDLVAATHGRAFWILDDLTPLYQLTAETSRESVRLLAPRDTLRFRFYGRGGEPQTGFTSYKMTGPLTVAYTPVETPSGSKLERFLDAGQNPPEGVIIHYWLGAPPRGPLELSILDAAGAEVRTFTSRREDTPEPPAEGELQQATAVEEVASEAPPSPDEGPWLPIGVGMHRFVWDARYAPPAKLQRTRKGGPREESAESGVAPRAIPGPYQVRLRVGDQVQTQPFTLLPDPRLPVSQADLQAQLELKLAIRDRLSELYASLDQIDRLRTQLDGWLDRARGQASAAQVREAARGVRERLDAIDRELTNVDIDKPRPGPNRIKEKLEALSGMIDESDHAPTQGAQAVYSALHRQLEAQQAALQSTLDGPVAAFNRLIPTLALPALAPTPR